MRSSEPALTRCESWPSKKDHTQSEDAWEAREPRPQIQGRPGPPEAGRGRGGASGGAGEGG